MKIDRRHEGWPDIPHGGVGMTSIIELADLADPSLFDQEWRADFRFGGDRLGVGDDVTVEILMADGVWRAPCTARGAVIPICALRSAGTPGGSRSRNEG
jgi:hypothetical protein